MPVLVSCSNCQKRLRVADTAVGKSVRCPACQAVFVARSAPPEAAIQAVPPPLPPPAEMPLEIIPAGPAAPSPGKPQRPRRRPFGPIKFSLTVRKDPDRAMKGAYQAELSEDGLLLTKKKKETLLPVGTPASYLGGNRIDVEIDGRPVQLVLVKARTYVHRLAEDVADYLSGELRELEPDDYVLPWYLFLPALLPLGIPILTLGGILPVALGVGLAGLCVATVQQERWPVALRLGIVLGMSALAYLVAILLLILVLQQHGVFGR